MIPPEWFPPDLQVLLYIYLFPTLVVLGIPALIILWKVVIPQVARELIWNRITKNPIVEWESDNGYTTLERAKAYPEGILVTRKSKQVFMLPRPIAHTRVTRIQKTETQSEDKVPPLEHEQVQRVALKRSILKSLGCPIVHAYAGKAIATNLSTLVGLEYTGQSQSKKMTILNALKKGIKKTKGGWNVNVLLPVDPRSMKRWFSHLWDQSQLRTRDKVSEQIGYERGKGEMKRMMIPLVIILIAGIAAMTLIYLMSRSGTA